MLSETGPTHLERKIHPNRSAAALDVGLKGYPESHRELNENLKYAGNRPLLSEAGREKKFRF